MSAVREPAVAGRFYEGGRDALRASLGECFLHPLGPGSLPKPAADGPGLIDAIISPHAGYMFSGPAAARERDMQGKGIDNAMFLQDDGMPSVARRGRVPQRTRNEKEGPWASGS